MAHPIFGFPNFWQEIYLPLNRVGKQGHADLSASGQGRRTVRTPANDGQNKGS
jgi:hypothetical protein